MTVADRLQFLAGFARDFKGMLGRTSACYAPRRNLRIDAGTGEKVKDVNGSASIASSKAVVPTPIVTCGLKFLPACSGKAAM
jgi:hypothetical protein